MPGTGTLLAAALIGSVALGTLAGTAIPPNMKTASGPDWRERYGAQPAMNGQDYYVEPFPEDLSPSMATASWLDSFEPGAADEPSALVPYAYDSDELADDASLPVSYDPAAPAAFANASADQQAAAADAAAQEVKQAEAEAVRVPTTPS